MYWEQNLLRELLLWQGIGSLFQGGHVAIQTTVEGEQIIYPNGRAEGTTIREGGEQLILRNGRAERTTIYSCGRQWVSSNGTVEHTTILKGGRMRFWSAGRIRGIDNFGLVEATDSVMNTIEDYIGRSGSVLKVEPLAYIVSLLVYPVATLERNTVLEANAKIILPSLTSTLTMRDNVVSHGGIIKIAEA